MTKLWSNINIPRVIDEGDGIKKIFKLTIKKKIDNIKLYGETGQWLVEMVYIYSNFFKKIILTTSMLLKKYIINIFIK